MTPFDLIEQVFHEALALPGGVDRADTLPVAHHRHDHELSISGRGGVRSNRGRDARIVLSVGRAERLPGANGNGRRARMVQRPRICSAIPTDRVRRPSVLIMVGHPVQHSLADMRERDARAAEEP